MSGAESEAEGACTIPPDQRANLPTLPPPEASAPRANPSIEQKARESSFLLELRVSGFAVQREGNRLRIRHQRDPQRRVPTDAVRRFAGAEVATRLVTDADGHTWEELEVAA